MGLFDKKKANPANKPLPNGEHEALAQKIAAQARQKRITSDEAFMQVIADVTTSSLLFARNPMILNDMDIMTKIMMRSVAIMESKL